MPDMAFGVPDRKSRAAIVFLFVLHYDLGSRGFRLLVRSPAIRNDQIRRLRFAAADLRRLARQRFSGPTLESDAWLAAVNRAYDHRLVVASETLGVRHHLTALDGMDRDLERMRLEEELRAAGLRLR